MMNYQDVLDVLSRTESANALTQQGIEHLDEGNLEDALSAFQASFEENPKSLPNLLYYSLCCHSLIRSKVSPNIEFINLLEVQEHIRGMIAKLEFATNLLKTNLRR